MAYRGFLFLRIPVSLWVIGHSAEKRNPVNVIKVVCLMAAFWIPLFSGMTACHRLAEKLACVRFLLCQTHVHAASGMTACHRLAEKLACVRFLLCQTHVHAARGMTTCHRLAEKLTGAAFLQYRTHVVSSLAVPVVLSAMVRHRVCMRCRL